MNRNMKDELELLQKKNNMKGFAWWMEDLQESRKNPESLPKEFSECIFNNLDSLLEGHGGVQEFIITEKEYKLIFLSDMGDHMKLFEQLESEIGEGLINRGGGFLSVNPFEKNIKILEKYSNTLGPIHIHDFFLREKLEEIIPAGYSVLLERLDGFRDNE